MSQPPSNPYPGSYPPPSQPGGYGPPQQPQYGSGYPNQQPGPQYGGGASTPQQPQYGGGASTPQQPQYGGGYPSAPQQPQYGGYPSAPEQPGQPQHGGGYAETGQPGYGAPVEPPKKKSKAGKIILIVVAVVVVLCLGGGAAIWFAAKDTVGEVVGATKTRLVEPETLGGRPKLADPQLAATAEDVKAQIKRDQPESTSIVGGIYGDPAKQDMVMIVGASAVMADPKKELDDAIEGLGAGLGATEFRTIDAGPLGGDAKCGDGKVGSLKVGICAWADRGSLGMIVLYFKDSKQLESQFVALRGEIEQKG